MKVQFKFLRFLIVAGSCSFLLLPSCSTVTVTSPDGTVTETTSPSASAIKTIADAAIEISKDGK